MDRRWRELDATGGFEDLGIEFGEALDRLLDGSLNSVFGAQVGERFAKDAIALSAEADHMTAEFQVRGDLGGKLADGLEAVAVRGFGPDALELRVAVRVALGGEVPGPAHGSHRWTQIRRDPRWSEGMARKRLGLDAHAVVVIKDIYLFLCEWVCRRKHEIKLVAIGPRGGLSCVGDGGRHQATAWPGSLVLVRIRDSAQARRSMRRYRRHRLEMWT